MDLVFHELVIVESLPEGEAQTGSDLFKFLRTTAPLPIPVSLIRCSTGPELLTHLASLAHRGAATGWLPILHFELHGNVQGLATASGDLIQWPLLVEPLRMLNIASRNSLVVIMAACEGAYIATAAAEAPFEPAPFCGIIGPSEAVNSFFLMHGFRAFYTDLARTKNFVSAIHELQQRSLPQYTAFDTADLFRKGRQRYQELMLTPEELKARAKKILKKRGRYGVREADGRKISRRETMRNILARKNLDEMWAHFVMADIYPENRNRFAPLLPGA